MFPRKKVFGMESPVAVTATIAPQIDSDAEERKKEKEIGAQYEKNMADAAKEKHPEFPYHALPPRTRAIISYFQQCDGYPKEYYAANALTAAAAILGVAFKVRYKKGHEHFPILYMCIVGSSSAGKGRSMSQLFKPINEIEKKYKNLYIENVNKFQNGEFEEGFNELADETQGKSKKKKSVEVIQEEIIVDDFTIESLIPTMYYNPRGLLLKKTEFLGWIASMNAYRAGSDEQFWLNNWDSDSYKVSRVGSGKIYIETSNVSVIGGVQPDLLHDVLAGSKGVSGFSARILFTYPESTLAPMDSDMEPYWATVKDWQNLIIWLHELPNNIAKAKTTSDHPVVGETVTIECCQAAKSLYKGHFNALATESNATDDDRIKSLIGKMQAYTMRFALIIEMLTRAEEANPYPMSKEDMFFDPKNKLQDPSWCMHEKFQSKKFASVDELQETVEIRQKSMIAAIAIANYYKETGKKVLKKLETPIDSEKSHIQAWYRALPHHKVFTYSVGLATAKKAGISESTYIRILNKYTLISKVGEKGYMRKIS